MQRLTHVLFITGCVIGCTIQSMSLTVAYFSYKTRPDTKLFHDKELPSPAVSICVEYISIVNQAKLREMFNGTTDRFSPNLTLNQLFQLTPNPADIMSKCAVRVPGEIPTSFRYENKTTCYGFFSVTRVFQLLDMCYVFRLRKPLKYNVWRVYQEEYGRVYLIALNDSIFSNVTYITTIIYDGDGLPTLSRYYAMYFTRRFENGTSKDTLFSYTYNRFHYRTLPAPFDTNCSRTSFVACYTNCHVKLISNALDRLPNNLMYPENYQGYHDQVYFGNYDLPFMTNDDFNNRTLYKSYNDLYPHCAEQCPTLACQYTITGTTLLSTARSQYDGLIEFAIHLPLTQTTSIEYRAQYPLNEYIVFFTSCVGTWLGISFINLNPAKLFNAWPLRGCRGDNARTKHSYLVRRYAGPNPHQYRHLPFSVPTREALTSRIYGHVLTRSRNL